MFFKLLTVFLINRSKGICNVTKSRMDQWARLTFKGPELLITVNLTGFFVGVSERKVGLSLITIH